MFRLYEKSLFSSEIYLIVSPTKWNEISHLPFSLCMTFVIFIPEVVIFLSRLLLYFSLNCHNT